MASHCVKTKEQKGLLLILDEDLKEIESVDNITCEDLLKHISEQHSGNINTNGSYDKKTEKKVVESDIPKEGVKFINWFGYIRICYSHHLVFKLRPEDLSFAFFCTISKYVVDNSDNFQSLFSNKKEEGREKILIEDDGRPMALRLEDILEEVNKVAPINIFSMLPEFSTDTQASKMARMSAFAEMISPYYSYMMFCCGFRGVRITGTSEDWKKLLDTINLFRILFGTIDESMKLKRYFESMSEIIGKIHDQVTDGEIDPEWINSIYINTTCGSGHDEAIAGWICKVYNIHWEEDGREPPMPHAFPSHITSVPYTVQCGDDKDLLLHYGLHSGSITDRELTPEYNYVINEV
jgi:hypothetical protein